MSTKIITTVRDHGLKRPVLKMDTVRTKDLVCDYIGHHLRTRDLQWPGPHLVLDTPGPVQRTMRELGDEFGRRYFNVFQDVGQRLELAPQNAQQTFTGVANELFSDGIRWGRIVALFAFGGMLAEHCIHRQMSHVVPQLVDWLTSYMEEHITPWIQHNGGWDGFVKFYESGGAEDRPDAPWPRLKAVCSIAVGALGVLTLGAFLANRT